MNTSASSRRPPLKFFVLLFTLSLPFWAVAAIATGGLPLPMVLPVSSLSVFCPLIAALLLERREGEVGGTRRLLRRAFDREGIKPRIWWVPVILSMPLIMVLSYGVMRLMGLPLPQQPRIPILAVPVLFVAYFVVAAVGEESGWMGYAVGPMQDRWSALRTAVILGAVTAIWHYVLFVQAHHGVAWIAWQSLFLVAARVLNVWLFNNTRGALLAAILFHDMLNLSSGLFPNGGSYYDPPVTGVITAIVALTVTLLWGARTLARYRYARSSAVATLPLEFEEVS
jgi:CAAX protease family protein